MWAEKARINSVVVTIILRRELNCGTDFLEKKECHDSENNCGCGNLIIHYNLKNLPPKRYLMMWLVYHHSLFVNRNVFLPLLVILSRKYGRRPSFFTYLDMFSMQAFFNRQDFKCMSSMAVLISLNSSANKKSLLSIIQRSFHFS